MKKQSRVRYLTIARVAIEIVSNLTDSENAQFNRILFACFKQLENNQPPEYESTDSPLLNVALREAIGELQEGYNNYIQRINAAKKDKESPIDQRTTADESPTDQRATIEEKEKERAKEIIKRAEAEEERAGEHFSDLEQQALNSALTHAGIEPDLSFWSFAKKVGYRITMDSIRETEKKNSQNLSLVVKLMNDKARGGI